MTFSTEHVAEQENPTGTKDVIAQVEIPEILMFYKKRIPGINRKIN
jgi:hypothetical protein